jgi:hypothetical protein
MKKLWLRFLRFAELWGSPDTWSDKEDAKIDAAFAWALAGPLEDFDD